MSAWGYLWGQLHMTGAGPELPPLVAARCSSLLLAYFATLNELGGAGLTISEKDRLMDKADAKFWRSEQALVYDDLYLLGDRDQYFNGSAYMRTLPAWYPQGVVFTILDLRVAGWAWASPDHLQVRMTWRRVLQGRDFLEQSRNDTVALEGYLGMALEANDNGILLHDPAFDWIRLVDMPAYSSHPVSPDSLPSSSIGVIAHLVDREPWLDEGSRVTPAPRTAALDQRQLQLLAAVTRYRAIRSAKSAKLESGAASWRPW